MIGIPVVGEILHVQNAKSKFRGRDPPPSPDVNIEFAALTSGVIKKIQTTIGLRSLY